MRYLRSYRFIAILSFTIGISVFIYRVHFVHINKTSLNILSNKIDERLHLLHQHFAYLNFSMLLDRPSSNLSSSITYRCHEWCGGCKYSKNNNKKMHSTSILRG